MTIAQILAASGIDAREAELLLANVMKREKMYLVAHSDDEVTPVAAKRFASLVARRLKHEPIAYIVGFQPFCGHDFKVSPATLVPRPETETLTELVIEKLNEDDAAQRTLVDIGTGSGCIAITIALACRDVRILAADVSSRALAVARKNAKLLGARLAFVEGNLLDDRLQKHLPKTGDVFIVANLPYLPSSYKKDMAPDVTKFEPSKALFAGKDGTALIVKLFKQIKNHLVSQERRVSVFLEIDPSQTLKLKKLASELFPEHHTAIKRDLYGRDRYLLIFP